MNADAISHYTKLPLKEVQYWVNQSSLIVYNDKKYIAALKQIDVEYLQKTLPLVHQVYKETLPSLKEEMAEEFNISVHLMSAKTLGDWVVGVLRYPESSHELRSKHKKLNGQVIHDVLPTLLEILGDLPEGAEEWQQALCLLSFPLMKK